MGDPELPMNDLDQREKLAIEFLVKEKGMNPKDAKVYVLQMIQVLGPIEFDKELYS